jgi:hypothetical protein
MSSDNYSSSQGHRPSESNLMSESIQVERKKFIFTLKENSRGKFLRITEDANGRRDNIILPASGLADFQRVIDSMVEEAGFEEQEIESEKEDENYREEYEDGPEDENEE